MAKRRRKKQLGSSADVHRTRALDNAAVARGALEAARGALQNGDCEMAWAAIAHAAENVGMLAANADGGGAERQPRFNRLPGGDPYGHVRADLLNTMESATTCFRKKK